MHTRWLMGCRSREPVHTEGRRKMLFPNWLTLGILLTWGPWFKNRLPSTHKSDINAAHGDQKCTTFFFDMLDGFPTGCTVPDCAPTLTSIERWTFSTRLSFRSNSCFRRPMMWKSSSSGPIFCSIPTIVESTLLSGRVMSKWYRSKELQRTFLSQVTKREMD